MFASDKNKNQRPTLAHPTVPHGVTRVWTWVHTWARTWDMARTWGDTAGTWAGQGWDTGGMRCTVDEAGGGHGCGHRQGQWQHGHEHRWGIGGTWVGHVWCEVDKAGGGHGHVCMLVLDV